MPGDTSSRSAHLGAQLAFAPGLGLIERGTGSLQIGVDPVQRILVRDPPPGTSEVLRLIDRSVPVAMATRSVAVRHGLPPGTWDDVIDELLNGGFLVDATVRTVGGGRAGQATRRPVPPERGSTGRDGARPLADAVVVVIGTGRVASSLASLLAAAGTGHVHLDPDRAVRTGDAAPAGLAADLLLRPDGYGHTSTRQPGRVRIDLHAGPPDRQVPRQRDRDVLAATLRRSRPEVTVHRPAGYVRPGLVVLALDGPPEAALSRRLVEDDQPHLAVHAGEHRGVVGPLVLPGRSSCLQCHDLYRRDRDAGWPHVRMALQRDRPAPPVVLATSVAAVGADQALQYLTGAGRPATVDGTLETAVGDWTVRRRSWRAHPACFCHSG